MTNSSPNSVLPKLHDYYQPAPPTWTPQTPGWYMLFALVGLSLLFLALHLLRNWLANRYRREALRELATIPPDQLSSLLKRTALAVWPREEVASLSGEPWLRFLDTTASSELFHNNEGRRIEEIALHPSAISIEEEQTLRTAAAEWIRSHRVQA
jgi:hypothetical protein